VSLSNHEWLNDLFRSPFDKASSPERSRRSRANGTSLNLVALLGIRPGRLPTVGASPRAPTVGRRSCPTPAVRQNSGKLLLALSL